MHFHKLLCIAAPTQFLIRALIPRSASLSHVRLHTAVIARVTGAAALQHFRQRDRGVLSIERWGGADDEQLEAGGNDVEACRQDERVGCACCMQ